MSNFKEISPLEIQENTLKLIGKDWGLLTSGTAEQFNSMTVSWGSMGIMWNKPVAFTFVRPQRYTIEFTENNDYSTLCFFDDSYREALTFCGTKSGRDFDKPKETGLTPVTDGLCPYYSQAKLVLILKKLYSQFLTPEGALSSIVTDQYKAGDYHKMYVSEIVTALIKE